MAKPERVRIQRPDGSEVPCELIHDGYDPVEDMDNWTATAPTPFRPGIDQLKADILPARTALTFEVSPGSFDTMRLEWDA